MQEPLNDDPDEDPGARTDVRREVAAIEHAFVRHGLPSFVAPRRLLRSAPTRALPLLATILLVEVTWLITADWAFGWQVAAATVVAGAGFRLMREATSRRRGRRSPRWVDYLWLSVFVGAAPVMGSVFGLGPAAALGFLALQILIAVLVVVGAIGGLAGAVLEAADDLVSGLAQSVPVLLRALPFLTLFSVIIFLTSETWQVFGSVPPERFGATLAVFGALGVIVLISRLPGRVRDLERHSKPDDPPLRPSQRRNIALVIAVQAVLQIACVVALMALVFVLLGSLVITDEIYRRWEVDVGPTAWRPSLFGIPAVVSGPLINVSVFVAVVCGLSYSVSLLTDPAYRADLLDRVGRDVTEMFDLRRRYLSLLESIDLV